MKKYLFFASALVLLSFGQPKAQAISSLFTTEYTSIPIPQGYHGDLSYLGSDLKITSKKTDEVDHNSTLLPSFPLVISAVTILQSDKSGVLSVAGQSISASNSNYVVIYDFTQTQQITIPQKDGSNISVLVGIAVRMIAKVHTKKSGINLSNLFGIGLAASQNKLVGSLEVKAFGMSSQKINEILPVPTDLSTGTIQTALSAVATIKSHIYDTDTKITPLFIAFNVTAGEKGKIQFDFQHIYDQIN